MTNSEDVAETETSVLVPSPKQNDAKDEGEPMDICVTKEETPTERESGNEMTLTNGPPTTSLWKKVGDVKALPLPMACTLTQFQRGNKYHFAVRAIDEHKRVGDFCEPQTIALS